MSFFKKLTKNPLNATLGGAVTSALGGKGLTDMLLGKKGGAIRPDEIAGQIRATQSQGLGDLNKALSTPADQVVREQFARQQQGMISAAADARRNAQQLMAQRGLQNSSLGIRAARGATQQLGEQSAALDAQLPGAIRQQAIQDAQTRMNAANALAGTGVRFQGQAARRSGGLLGIASSLAPLAGTVAGAAFGGPAGAAIGSKLGSGLGSAMAGVQGSGGYSGQQEMMS